MIPQFDEIRMQALKELSAGGVMRAKELRTPLAKHSLLTEEEMTARDSSGNEAWRRGQELGDYCETFQ